MIKKISPCPIIETVIQINCTFTVDQDVVVGLIYSLLQDKTDASSLQIEKLPILNLPEEIRRADQNLRDKPWYKINCGDHFIMIGLFGIALGITPPYKGWNLFKSFSVKVFNILRDHVIKDVSAISLKYLDFFSNVNIFEKINCDFRLNGMQITAIPTIFRTELPDGNFIKIIQITNGVHLYNQTLGIDSDGSLIEINLFTRNVSVEKFDQITNEAHLIQKESFFELLSEDFLKTFKVEYE